MCVEGVVSRDTGSNYSYVARKINSRQCLTVPFNLNISQALIVLGISISLLNLVWSDFGKRDAFFYLVSSWLREDDNE